MLRRPGRSLASDDDDEDEDDEFSVADRRRSMRFGANAGANKREHKAGIEHQAARLCPSLPPPAPRSPMPSPPALPS